MGPQNRVKGSLENNCPEMRVAIASVGELYGGVEQYIYLYARHLGNLDHIDVTVILFEDSLLYKKLKDVGIETYLVQSRFKHDPRLVAKVVQILSRRRVDVVHTHGYKANLICALAARRVGAAIVKTEHGRLNFPFRLEMRSMKMYANWMADQLITLALVKDIVYVSYDLAARFRAVHACKSRTVIHNAIAPVPTAETSGLDVFDRHHFNIGVVGRVDRVKGHIFMLKAVESLSDIRNLRVHIIGRGPLESELKEYCISHGIDSRVRFWGFRKDIHAYMRNLDILVVPSLHEGLPYTVLEAMYLRVPIVASAVGGLREALKNEENAVLVPSGDHEELAVAIRRLHDEPERRNSISQRAFLDVMSRFMIDDMAQRYADVYLAALSRAAGRGRSGKGRPQQDTHGDGEAAARARVGGRTF